MAEYIERAAVKNLLDRYGATDDALALIDTIPTADVAEVRHGTWITPKRTIYGCPQYMCSECKEDEYWTRRFCHGDENYCPNCGALMREDDNGKE